MYLTAAKTRFYCERAGSGTPVLMIHGFGPDSRLMKGCMERVFASRAGFERIYFDLPGMGRTKASKSAACADGMLEAVMAFAEKATGGSEFLIAAESYGCYLARGLIKKAGTRVAGAAFIAPVVFPWQRDRKLPDPAATDAAAECEFEKTLAPGEIAELRDKLFVRAERNWKRLKAEVLSGYAAGDQKFLDGFFERSYSFSFDPDALDEPFGGPALIITGRQDAVTGFEDALGLLEIYPKATFAALDSGGHFLQIERETAFSGLVLDWLDRIGERRMRRD